MSLAQAMYILKRSTAREDEDRVETSTTKQDLRTTPNVKVRNTTKGWGRNVIESIINLNPAFGERMKQNTEYKKELDRIVKEIEKNYLDRE